MKAKIVGSALVSLFVLGAGAGVAQAAVSGGVPNEPTSGLTIAGNQFGQQENLDALLRQLVEAGASPVDAINYAMTEGFAPIDVLKSAVKTGIDLLVVKDAAQKLGIPSIVIEKAVGSTH